MALGHKHEIVKVNSTQSNLLDKLAGLTDDDYNGNNGEEYFVAMNTEYGDLLVSRLERSFTRCRAQKKTDINIIRDILDDNYSDSYYKEPSIEVTQHGEFIFISVAYNEQN